MYSICFLQDYSKSYPNAKIVGPKGLVEKRKDVKFDIVQPDHPLDEDLAKEFKAIALTGHPNEVCNLIWNRQRDRLSVCTKTNYWAESFSSLGLPSSPLKPLLLLLFLPASLLTQDIVWIHTPSKTLIEADALFNLPCSNQKSGILAWLFPNFLLSQMSPDTGFHRSTVKAFSKGNPAAFRESAKQIDSVDFQRLIPCHGEVIPKPDLTGTSGGGSSTITSSNAAKEAWRAAYREFVVDDGKTK